MINNLLAKLIGKKVGDQFEASKTKITAIVYVIVQAVPVISTAFGHPVEIPPIVFRFLEAAGLWSLRSAFPDGK